MVWIEGCQIEVKRYALLDTDFISKTHSVQDDGGNHLIDRVMELPEYEFFCHAQIVTELNRYNADTPIWLSEKIGAQKIKSYTDQEILESLSLVRGPLACATYTQMLKLACDAFSRNYFSEHYRALEDADYATISNEDYLKELQLLDIEVGKKNNLGEIKSFVLLQVLSVMLGEQIYVFCSDDKNARNGATNFEDVRCISLVSVFSRLKEESNWTLADAEPYIESLIAFYQDHHQSRRKTSMEQELKNLKGEKMRMYEEYAAGTLSLDNYKNKKQEYDRKIAEVQDKIEQSKAEEAAQSVVPGTVRAAAEQAENFLHGTRLTASMVSAFIENVYVHEGGRIVVQFKYEQSIQDAVRALHTD